MGRVVPQRTSGTVLVTDLLLVPAYPARVSFDLAQVNVSRLLAPIDSPVLTEFMAALDEINAEGDAAGGFRWRLQTEDGNATAVRAFGWDVGDSHGVIVNLTTWASVQALGDFVFSGQHLQVMRRRRQVSPRVSVPSTPTSLVASNAANASDQLRSRAGRTASVQAFSAITDTRPPGCTHAHIAPTSGSGRSKYISTPWHRTAANCGARPRRRRRSGPRPDGGRGGGGRRAPRAAAGASP